MSLEILRGLGDPEVERLTADLVELSIDEWPALIGQQPHHQRDLVGVLVSLSDRQLLAVVAVDELDRFADTVTVGQVPAFCEMVRKELHDLAATPAAGLWRLLVLVEERVSDALTVKRLVRLRVQLGKGPLA